MLPQLRLRTEFSFRETFAPIGRIVERLKAINAPGAGIVDGGTWGHVRFAKAMGKAGLKPMFGTELVVPKADGRKPTAWFLAADIHEFYRFSSRARRPGADIEMLAASTPTGVLRFAGSALEDEDLFDYVDMNPSSVLDQRRALRLAERTGKPLVLTSDNSYCSPADYDAYMGICGREKVTPQWILSPEEFRAQFKILDDYEYARAIQNTIEAASRCTSELPKAPIIQVAGDLNALAVEGRDRRLALGHLKSWPEEYEKRLQRELAMVAQKKFESYFIVVADLIMWAKERMLVGPGRGSSAGSLLCYCLGITEVDPIPHGLLFERFIDVTRADLPDIDIDFSDTKREQVFEYLSEKYGRENVARIGNINTLKPRSALAEVCKRMGVPDGAKYDLANSIIEYSSGDSRFGHALEDTMATTDPGQRFRRDYPDAAEAVKVVENHAWHTGVHAAGVIVCNVPVVDYCTVNAEGVAQIDKPDSEHLNLLKIDALGLRTLGIIEDAGVIDGPKLYGLKLDDPEVLGVFNEHKFSGIFQFEGDAQKIVSKNIVVDDFKILDHITALARPGPLGGGAADKYINRKAGREPIEYTHPKLAPILSDTYGVVLYQEQVMRIVREIGKFSWEDTTVIRKAMSGRKGTEFFNQQGEKFIAGALQDGITSTTAAQIWHEICSFGAWGMNKSHTCAYAVISYWCGWMKRYHRLEFAAACLRSAKDEAQTYELLRELCEEGVTYTPFDLERSQLHWSVSKDGKLVGGFQNLVGFGPAKSAAAVEARDAKKIPPKMLERIQKAEVKFADLRPIYTAYGHMIDNPQQYGCRAGSFVSYIGTIPESGDVLIIGRITKKKHGDYNEAVRIAKRGGRKMKGQTLFVDLTCFDDSGGPLLCRIDRDEYTKFGMKAFSNLQVDDVIMMRGEKIPNFSMIKIERIRCLNNPEAMS